MKRKKREQLEKRRRRIQAARKVKDALKWDAEITPEHEDKLVDCFNRMQAREHEKDMLRQRKAAARRQREQKAGGVR